jgi:hypothetical protein
MSGVAVGPNFSDAWPNCYLDSNFRKNDAFSRFGWNVGRVSSERFRFDRCDQCRGPTYTFLGVTSDSKLENRISAQAEAKWNPPEKFENRLLGPNISVPELAIAAGLSKKLCPKSAR